MRSNLHRKLPLEEIASAVDVSVWWLCHIFKSETGLSPIQYLKTLRMERARHLLQTSSLSFRNITRGVGYRMIVTSPVTLRGCMVNLPLTIECV